MMHGAYNFKLESLLLQILEVAAIIKRERGLTHKINFILAASLVTEMNLLPDWTLFK